MTMLDLGQLREEASHEPDPVPTGPVTKETQIIAIYGKGGSGQPSSHSSRKARSWSVSYQPRRSHDDGGRAAGQAPGARCSAGSRSDAL